MGESLVGAYLRHVERCTIVTYNSFFPDRQGEVDVVGVKPAQDGQRPQVFLCEVTTHTRGMLIVRRGKDATEAAVSDKLARLQEFAAITFPAEEYEYRYQWWSPVVAEGKLTDLFKKWEAEWEKAGRSLEFIYNDNYSARITELVEDARQNSSTVNEPAYRLLQILTRMRGSRPKL